MSISSNSRKAGPYSGNDVATAFAFAFKVFSTADVLVVFTSASNVETNLTLTTDYTVTLNSDQDTNPGGTVTLPAALATGTKLTLTSSVADLQPVTLTNNGGFYPRVINDALDRATIQIQQLSEKVGRALVWPISSGSASLPVPEANKFIGWNATADSLVNFPGVAVGDAQTVSFDQEGTGAVTRTAQDKMRDSVSVTDFSVDITGVTNSATGLQNALNTGKNVIIPEWCIVGVSSQVFMKSNKQQLIVNGKIKALAAMDSVIKSTDFDDVGIQGVGTIDGNSLAISGVEFVADTRNTYRPKVSNITITGTATDATLFYGGVLVRSTGGKAGLIRHKDVSITGVTTKDCGTHGVLIAYADGVLVSGNTFSNCTNHGHESVNCSTVRITDNTAENCTLSGVGVGDSCVNWLISGNTVRNCGGDGSITCEHNSIVGSISGNVIYESNTQGINVSFGTPGSAPFEKLRDIVVSDNVMFMKSSVVAPNVGINVYSSTGPAVGEGIHVSGNVIHGYNIGITYAYCSDGSICDNTILNLSKANSGMIKATMVSRVDICRNHCNSDTGDHAIKLLSYAGISSDRVNVSDNSIFTSASAAKSLLYVEGTGSHKAVGNNTQGSLHYVECAGASTVVVGDNYGNLASTSFSGGTIQSGIGSASSTTVGAAGAASALPAAPRGYVTVFVPDVGQVKVPYYNL